MKRSGAVILLVLFLSGYSGWTCRWDSEEWYYICTKPDPVTQELLDKVKEIFKDRGDQCDFSSIVVDQSTTRELGTVILKCARAPKDIEASQRETIKTLDSIEESLR